jgi:hypothetical protein
MLVNFMAMKSILLPLRIFHGHFIYFVVSLVYFSHFGMLYQEKSGNPKKGLEEAEKKKPSEVLCSTGFNLPSLDVYLYFQLLSCFPMKFRFIPFLSFFAIWRAILPSEQSERFERKKGRKNLDCGRNSAGGHPVTNSTKLQRMCLIKKPVVT